MNNYNFELIKYSYIRGFIKNNKISINSDILNKTLDELNENDKLFLQEIATKHSLKLYYFKEKDYLPRVNIVLGFLKGIYPESLLDIGSGRGVFLFPLLKELGNINITSMEILPRRHELMKNISDGGINNLNPIMDNITTTKLDKKYDVVTMLEVLEHIPDVDKAIENAIKLAKDYIVITVPSKEDDNPEHIHLLTKDILTNIFNSFGVTKLSFSGVNGHLFLIAKMR